MNRKRTKRPKATAITENMPLAEKVARIRRRMRSGGAFDTMHPHAKRPKHYKTVHSWKKRARFAGKQIPNLDSYRRRNFTSVEIEAMYLAVYEFLAYFGGNKSLAARTTGITLRMVTDWANKGRVSALGADIIGECTEVPFTREQMRPDITKKGWKEFDKVRDRLYQARKPNEDRE